MCDRYNIALQQVMASGLKYTCIHRALLVVPLINNRFEINSMNQKMYFSVGDMFINVIFTEKPIPNKKNITRLILGFIIHI